MAMSCTSGLTSKQNIGFRWISPVRLNPVTLEWTPCNLGGRRLWFRCPARGCGRRVAILFGGSVFACRHCHKLAYASQRERGDYRDTRRADRIREKLQWEPGILNGDGYKPKGMHWRTYERLVVQHDAHVEESLAGMARRLGLVGRGLDGIGDLLKSDR